MTVECLYRYLARCTYREAYALQMILVKKRIESLIPDTLLLLTHMPVYTIGRAGTRKHILVSDAVLEREGLDVYEIDRGGDITYHGPGQLVVYPILDLRQHGKDLHMLTDQYEEVIIQVLGEYGVEAGRIPEHPGVWVGREKICALGIGVSNWVSYHGLAININPNMVHFSYIMPCGIPGKGVTSLSNILGKDIQMEEVVAHVVKKFGEIFKLKMREGAGTIGQYEASMEKASLASHHSASIRDDGPHQ